MSEHTETPWKHSPRSTNVDIDVATAGTIYGGGWHLALIFADGEIGRKTAEANAVLIVRAVNSHAALVEALREIVAAADAGVLHDIAAEQDFADSRQIKQARAALALAQEGT